MAVELARAAGSGGTLAVPRPCGTRSPDRLLELDESDVAMLRRLAIVEAELDPAGVLAMTGLTEADGFALLDKALAAGVLVVVDSRYRFRHDLVRLALAGQLSPHQRIAMHRDAARRLIAPAQHPAAIARHWLAGEQPAQATPWLLEAARRAVKVGAYREALRHVDTLLEHDERQSDALSCVHKPWRQSVIFGRPPPTRPQQR